jgi:hypothetical protein
MDAEIIWYIEMPDRKDDNDKGDDDQQRSESMVHRLDLRSIGAMGCILVSALSHIARADPDVTGGTRRKGRSFLPHP